MDHERCGVATLAGVVCVKAAPVKTPIFALTECYELKNGLPTDGDFLILNPLQKKLFSYG
jgi:hypothetical protein